MEQVISRDGTPIAVDTYGSGPALILVDGAMCSRGFGPMPALAKALASRFTVYHYDRRGRGESGDSANWSLEREIEDLEAVLTLAGGAAMAFGMSSGAALAAEAARRLPGIMRLALYEAPFVVDDTHAPLPPTFVADTRALVTANRRGEAVRKFMRYVGTPAPIVFVMSMLPFWKKLTAVAHTLGNDLEIIAPHHQSRPLPADKWAGVGVPTLVMDGGKSPVWMRNAMKAWAAVLPKSVYRTLAGQNHMVKADVLAPELIEFLTPAPATVSAKELAFQR